MAKGDAVREIINDRMDKLNPTTRDILESMPNETVRKTYAKLLELGLSKEKIASRAELLGMNPDTIQRNANSLRELGLTNEKIATCAHLLSMNPDTIQRNAESLRELGLSKEKIATLAQLLGMNPDTIQRNYEFLRRFFSKEEIMKNAQLLGSSQKTIESSVQSLHQLGVDYKEIPFACGTKVGTKRKKIAVLLREKYGYDANLSKEERKELAEKAREFVCSRQQILIMSKKAIKKKYCQAA